MEIISDKIKRVECSAVVDRQADEGVYQSCKLFVIGERKPIILDRVSSVELSGAFHVIEGHGGAEIEIERGYPTQEPMACYTQTMPGSPNWTPLRCETLSEVARLLADSKYSLDELSRSLANVEDRYFRVAKMPKPGCVNGDITRAKAVSDRIGKAVSDRYV